MVPRPKAEKAKISKEKLKIQKIQQHPNPNLKKIQIPKFFKLRKIKIHSKRKRSIINKKKRQRDLIKRNKIRSVKAKNLTKID